MSVAHIEKVCSSLLDFFGDPEKFVIGTTYTINGCVFLAQMGENLERLCERYFIAETPSREAVELVYCAACTAENSGCSTSDYTGRFIKIVIDDGVKRTRFIQYFGCVHIILAPSPSG